MIPGESNAYCYTLGKGMGPKSINGENIVQKEHDMKDSTDMITKMQVKKETE